MVVIRAALLLAAVVQTGRGEILTNGGFETGDLSLWTVTIPTGTSSGGGVEPAGTVEVVASFSRVGGEYVYVAPHGGDYFAAIGSANSAYFTNVGSVYDVTAGRTLTLLEGQTVSGWAVFYNGDFEAQDTASVRVFDSIGQLVSTPWSDTSGFTSPGGVPFLSASEWTSWQWQAPAAGDYTIEVGVTTRGDDRFASFGLFDDITVQPVPEPSVVALIGGGLGLLGAVRRRFVPAGRQPVTDR